MYTVLMETAPLHTQILLLSEGSLLMEVNAYYQCQEKMEDIESIVWALKTIEDQCHMLWEFH